MNVEPNSTAPQTVHEEHSWYSPHELKASLKSLVSLVIIVLLLRGTIIEPFRIPSGSMIPTLRPGDHILVWKLSYALRLPFLTYSLFDFRSPHRGDVVVFTRPDDPATTLDDESSINLIKRIIGLPGDTLEVRNMRVYINNHPLDEEYARWVDGGPREGEFGPVKIPEGHVLVLGDNRDQSKDSRFWPSPFLDISRIKGRAFIIYWSWESPGRIGTWLRSYLPS